MTRAVAFAPAINGVASMEDILTVASDDNRIHSKSRDATTTAATQELFALKINRTGNLTVSATTAIGRAKVLCVARCVIVDRTRERHVHLGINAFSENGVTGIVNDIRFHNLMREERFHHE